MEVITSGDVQDKNYKDFFSDIRRDCDSSDRVLSTLLPYFAWCAL
jgi:hypothetical protein